MILLFILTRHNCIERVLDMSSCSGLDHTHAHVDYGRLTLSLPSQPHASLMFREWAVSMTRVIETTNGMFNSKQRRYSMILSLFTQMLIGIC